ncbi:MAG: calcium-translocating P-type ATPase, PMCA-type [Oscillospiraceae bacterium]|nr:calcium-translocating P-type ATPase, PMCA-type [Oscillospiraceae bacterium]
MNNWHHLSLAEVIENLETDRENGLSRFVAEKKLEQHGKNELQAKARDSMVKRFFLQMKDPMILVLIGAAILSFVASGFHDWIESVIILAIVILNSVISIIQESNAEKALEALRKMSAPLAKVIRDGEIVRIEANLLVPGDIFVLEAGDLIPADGRIIECANLRADEAAMTGESVPVTKQAIDSLSEETGLGDRKNMVISSTVVTNGRGTCVVTATGMNTEVGRIADMLMSEGDTVTPLQKKLSETAKVLSLICLGVCAVMFGVGLFYGRELMEVFMSAVALAVAAIPEGLPAVVVITLALGVTRMVKRNAIIRRLPAVETLGCAGVICSDKTGTLTQNKMTVVNVWTVGENDRALALTIGTLCNDANLVYEEENGPKTLGDPTETALVDIAVKEGLDKNELEKAMPRIGELPFDSERKLMSTLHQNGDTVRVMVKGAPDVLLSRCNIDKETAKRIVAQNEEMAGDALRVLGVAYKDIGAMPSGDLESEEIENGLTFVGLAGMIDPPRVEVKDAVDECYVAGIRPVMITGDHKLTAVAIAKQLDIFKDGDLAIIGEELNMLSQEDLEANIERYSVFARVSPEHKMRIVKAWQSKGFAVAMTGDGVNDAPALKVADIGCAMGITGTDVAKGAADMILTDDNFSTIVHAVEEGRGIYANIKKTIQFLLSCNLGEILILFFATVLNFTQMPLVAVQLLWINLVTDSLPALALGMEPVEKEIMKQKPRKANESLFNRDFTGKVAFYGILIAAVTLASYFIGEYVLGHPVDMDDGAITMAFTTLVLCELTRAYAVRSDTKSIFQVGLFKNKSMNIAFAVCLGLQLIVLLVPPLHTFFRVSHMDLQMWGICVGLSLIPLAVSEVAKVFRRARAK